MKHLLLTSLFILSSCASALKKDEATNIFIEKTSLSKSQAFNQVLGYLAKTLNDSNEAIKLKDKEAGKIIAKIGVDCNDLRAFADVTSYVAYYTLEVDVKDKKLRLNIVGESYSQFNINGSIITANSPMHSGHKDGQKVCAKEIKNKLISSITKRSSEW